MPTSGRQAERRRPVRRAPTTPVAPMRALAQRRIDRRTIVGGMYERQINANTVLTVEADYDVKDINQYFSQITDNVESRTTKLIPICGTTVASERCR